jgi:hypothetical protein
MGVCMDWIKYFEKKIIDRGEEYYKNGKIANFCADGLTRKATVIGSEEYNVEITFNSNGELVSAKCDCPYAEKGEYCKHMVAVLLYDERGEVPYKPKKSTLKRKLPSDYIEGESYGDYVKRKQAENRGGPNGSKTNNSFDKKIEVPLSQYKKDMTAIISSYKHSGYISYWDAVECCQAVLDKFEEVSDFLISNFKLKEAFEYSYFVMKKFSTTDMDDSDGEIGDVCSACINVWAKLILDENTCDYCFKKIYKYLQSEHDKDWYMLEQVESFFLDNFMDKKYFDTKIGFVEGKIILAQKNHYDYEMENALIAELEMLEKMGGYEQKINAIIRKYWRYEKVEKFYITKCIANKQYDEAEKILIELIDMPKKSGVKKSYCLQTLLDIYKETKNNQLYRDTLYRYVCELNDVTIEEYIELKGLYFSDEWLAVLKKLLPCVKVNNKDLYAEILLNEDRKNELADFIIAQDGLYFLKKYENNLKDDYPEKLLNKYCQELKTMVIVADNRDKYKDIVRLLRKMNTYKGGSKIVRELVECWKLEYRRRPAFMQELNKVILN